MEKAYQPQIYEKTLYERWLKSGAFAPQGDGESFTIIMPPPNATGTLHLGHALEYSLQDAIIRFQRMRGKKTLWLPGTDHAAIATNTKVEKLLIKEEGKNRHAIGREAFVKKVEDFVAASRGTMQEQIRQMGASVDWSREAFTLDEPRSLAVRTAFKRMYDAGLIYRGYRVINWDPKGQTAVSDDEVQHRTERGVLYTFRYAPDFPIAIASTRPETKVGDTAVAVNPDDKRYQQYIGRTFSLEFAGTNLSIQIVADSTVDPEFGTGAVGVTPAHSLVDAQIAQRQSLPMKQVINEYGRMTQEAGTLVVDKKTKEAREIIVAWLKESKLLEKEESIDLNISVAERSGGVIEPLPKLQWFIAVDKEFVIEKSSIKSIKTGSQTTLKEIMRQGVENGQIEIMPDRFKKIYFHWIDNLRDWNISRQLWYGHRIPAWYCLYCLDDYSAAIVLKDGISVKGKGLSEGNVRLILIKQLRKKFLEQYPNDWKQQIENIDINGPSKNGVIVSIEEPSNCPRCKKQFIVQDPDTLDTWFSSALWTFSTLGWPDENAKDLKEFHPTSFMNPGYEILFFWVARMILMSGFLLGEVPFKIVYLHGMLRDAKGRKFSKSLDNGIDPIEVIRKYGADALRMSLIVGVGPGNDSNFDLNKVKAYQHFANKIWNAARFVAQYINKDDEESKLVLSKRDKQVLKELEEMAKEVTQDMESFTFYLAAQKLYHYFWHTFADVIIEEAKPRLQEQDAVDAKAARHLLITMLKRLLVLLHPFMPFITEAIWQELSLDLKHGLLINHPWN